MEEISFLRLIVHLKSKSTSLIVFQKSISKPILLSEIAHSSWQRTFRGRCNFLIFEVKRQGSSVFAGRFFKKITVLVINCSGNIHTSEIIFHFNCDIMVVDRLGKSFQYWKLQGKNEFQIQKLFIQEAVIAVP